MSSKRERNLGDLIAEGGMTVTSAALELGVSRQTIYNWIHGVHMPKIEHVRRIARMLRLSEFTVWASVARLVESR